MAAIDRLKALEEAGVALSRNRHFELFNEPENKRALTLNRYLDTLAEEIQEGAKLKALTLTLAPDEHGRLALGVARSDIAVQHTPTCPRKNSMPSLSETAWRRSSTLKASAGPEPSASYCSKAMTVNFLSVGRNAGSLVPRVKRTSRKLPVCAISNGQLAGGYGP